MRDYDVTKRDDGDWQAKRAGAKKAASIQRTQGGAQKAANDLARNSGGGEVRMHRPNGWIRNSNTIGKSDLNPPRDTKH